LGFQGGVAVTDEQNSNSRRNFLKSAIVGISAVTLSSQLTPTLAAAPAGEQESFFSESERRFLESAVDRLIPPDEKWPGASGAGVVNYIDKQMAGAWGRGDLVYRHGPFREGTPGQGYQFEYAPAELFRRSITAINSRFADQGASFEQLTAEEKDSFLANLEHGGMDLDGVPSNVFFDQLFDQTVQGFFSDPMYGGNKNKVGWRMIGFPGAYADYYDLVDKHGIAFYREPLGIEDGILAHSMMQTGGE
jgi:gluconate 2-dehydrogenase gamma chain